MKLRERPSDTVAMGQAIRDNPRLPGEDAVVWMERVLASVGLGAATKAGHEGARQPGEEG